MTKESKPRSDDTGSTRGSDPKHKLSLRGRFQTRLLMWLILLSAGTSVVAGTVYYLRQIDFIKAEQTTRGRTLISNLAGQSELGAYSGDRTFLLGPARRAFSEPDVTFVVIYNRRGEPLIQLSKPDAELQPQLAPRLLRRLGGDASGQPIQQRRANHIDFAAPIVSLHEDAEHGLFGDVGTSTSVVLGMAHLGLSLRPAMRKLREVLVAGIRVSLIVLAMGVLVALFLSRRLSRPILALAKGADKLRSGELGVQIEIKRSDELGLLAESFNKMSSKLQETVSSLEHLNRNLEAEVNRRTVALRRSRDFISLLNIPLQLRKLLDTALDALLRITEATSGAIYTRGGRGRLDLAVSQGALAHAFSSSADPETTSDRNAEESSGWDDLLRRSSRAERSQVAPIPADLPLAEESPPGSALLCMPIRYRERLEAIVVLVLSRKPGLDQVDFVENACSQLAIAVSNARAYAAAERLARKLEQRNVALLQQRDQLKEVNRLKSEFLANVSHELRTPLNAVIGYTELLADGIYGEVNDEQEQSLGGITENATSLLELINQILDLSKVEAGKMSVAHEPVDLRQIVIDVVEASAPLAKDRPYDLDTRLPDRPLEIDTDAGKVRQILVNLLSNAIKFTWEGSITISLEEAAGGARIDVTDTGIGISEADLSMIFDEFRQVDGSSTRKHGGSGLGLAISKKLANLVDGDLLVSSRVGEGSTFTLLLGSRGMEERQSAEIPVSIEERPLSAAEQEARQESQ